MRDANPERPLEDLARRAVHAFSEHFRGPPRGVRSADDPGGPNARGAVVEDDRAEAQIVALMDENVRRMIRERLRAGMLFLGTRYRAPGQVWIRFASAPAAARAVTPSFLAVVDHRTRRVSRVVDHVERWDGIRSRGGWPHRRDRAGPAAAAVRGRVNSAVGPPRPQISRPGPGVTAPVQASAAAPAPSRPLSEAAAAALGAVATALAVLRAVKGVPWFSPAAVDEVTVASLAVPALLLSLREAHSIKLGKDGIEFTRRIEEQLATASRELAATRTQMADVAQRSRAVQAAAEITRLALLGVGGPPAAAAVRSPERDGRVPRGLEDGGGGPPGGSATADGRRLTARVLPVAGIPELFRVRLRVEPLLGAPPLGDPVIFHLPRTFVPCDLAITPVGGGAAIERLAYGAFAVCADVDGGRTRLELDLRAVEGLPRAFVRG